MSIWAFVREAAFHEYKEVIWAVSFDSLLEPNPYIDVDDVMGHKPN